MFVTVLPARAAQCRVRIPVVVCRGHRRARGGGSGCVREVVGCKYWSASPSGTRSASHPQSSTQAWWRGVVHDAGFPNPNPRKDEWKGTITIKFTSDEGSPTTFQGQDVRKRFARERQGPEWGSKDDRFVVEA